MNNIFYKGDIVTLKSQFNPMTVYSITIDMNKIAYCQWCDSDGKLINERFDAVALRKVSAEELKKYEKQMKRREDARAGSSLSDKAFKWATLIGALTAAVASIAVAVK